MSLAMLTGCKVSIVEPHGTATIQFHTLDAALSALVRYKWAVVSALDSHTVLFKHLDENTLHLIAQLQMAARLAETMANRQAIARLSVEAAEGKTVHEY